MTRKEVGIMSKYMVTIMGNKIMEDKEQEIIEGFITINKKDKIAADVVDLRDIMFNPMELLGDLRYISENMCCYDSELMNTLIAPYEYEPCLKDIEISDREQYFFLLDKIRDIIYQDREITLLEVYKLANYANISIGYHLSFRDKKDENGLSIYQQADVLFNDYSKNKLIKSDFIYYYPCDNISEIVIAVLVFLVMFGYHFYQCQHCKRYSAELRHQKDRRYCYRENLLQLPNYEGMSCNKAIPIFLNSLYQTYSRKEKRLYNRRDVLNTDKALAHEMAYDEFKAIYNEKRENIKKDPSVQNLIGLKDYLDSIKIERKKKKQ